MEEEKSVCSSNAARITSIEGIDGKGKKTENLPNFHQSVRLKYVKLGYHYLISHAIYLLLLPLIGVVWVHLSTLKIKDLVLLWDHLRLNLVSTILISGLMVFLGTFYLMIRPRKIYLVDFACYKPGPEFMCSRELFMKLTTLTGKFNEENLAFQKKIMERLGFGQKTFVAKAFLQVPPNPSIAEARKEAEMVIFGAIDQLFAKTGKKAKDIGILVVNCSVFCPTPSLSAMIVNHYKLRGNILSFNLGGMGCSAGVIAIDLAKDLLQVINYTLSPMER